MGKKPLVKQNWIGTWEGLQLINSDIRQIAKIYVLSWKGNQFEIKIILVKLDNARVCCKYSAEFGRIYRDFIIKGS